MIISASNNQCDLTNSLISGADHYLHKPFRPNVLRAHVLALMRRPS
jgi:DNA-binding response OmpR family regulator